MARKLKRGELTTKNMDVLRETDQTKIQQEKKIGTLKDYTLQHRVAIVWDLNEDADNDHMVKLVFDDQEAILDVEEIMRYIRWA